jgi:phosphoglycolate phosphatase-like HAD superfamily hydrolase
MSRGRGNTQASLRQGIFGDAVNKQLLLQEYAELGTIIDDLDHIETMVLRLRSLVSELTKAERDIIIDLDDTLSVNNTLYIRSKTELAKYLQRKVGTRTVEEYIQAFDAIDEGLIPSWGFTPARWHESARRLAEQELGRTLRPGELGHVRKLSGIALGVGIPFPDTYEALRTARKAGMRIVLKTKGEEKLQQEKIMAHQFSPFFAGIEIVQAKTPESMRALAKHYRLRNPVMIGDSMKSDVLPAHEAGFGAVLMRYHNEIWDYENPDTDYSPARAQCLAEALVLIAEDKI